MTQVSRPLLGLLVATVAVFSVWTFALKGGSSTSTGAGGKTGLGAYQSAIDKAHQAVATSNAASARHGGTVASAPSPTTATTPAARSATATTATAARRATVAQQVVPAATRQLNIVEQALRDKKVIALLFFNPAAADDKAVKAELAAVPTHGTKVVKLAVPITELSHFTAVTNQVPVNGSPTLVLVNGARQAATIVGFADRFEIAQRVSDALAVR